MVLLLQHARRRRHLSIICSSPGCWRAANYNGFLAVEIDFLHPDYNDDEDAAVARSVEELRRIAAAAALPV